MKTKNKMITIVEIAIVLCSVFLVIIPVIAADQTMQEVSTSANTITTASEDDYVLEIYGNGNEDDTIDMGDVVYTKLAIFGKKPKTELCDAKYDGRINVLDVIETKLIILGKEKELTYVDIFEEAETINKPIERIVDMVLYPSEVLRILNAEDRVVAVSTSLRSYPSKRAFFPELSKLPVVGGWHNPDYEAILSHNPDAILTFITGAATWERERDKWSEKIPGIPIIELAFTNPPIGNKFHELSKPTNDLIQSTRKLGYILDEEDEAQKFRDWYEGYFNTIKSRTDELSEDEKPKVYYERNTYSVSSATVITRIIDVAGGINIVMEGEGSGVSGEVDPEWVMMQNPDIILSNHETRAIGYQIDDTSGIIETRDSILNRPELANVNAVKNERVYVFSAVMNYGPQNIIAIAYCAKWFHPDLFKDLDPKAIHQEYLDKFHEDLNFNVYEHGAFVYPPFED